MEEHHSNILITALCIAIVFAVIIGGLFGLYGFAGFAKNFHRHQKLADARNQVTLNEIQIQQTRQLVQVQQQKAQIKVAEAHGIAESQAIINGTLTPQYLQHEAIQAQESQSNKIIYVPSGNQGIPLVQTTNQ